MMKDTKQFLWSEKYRPDTISECVLPSKIKETFQLMVNRGDISNLLFCGGPGVGKTTVAKALCKEMSCDWIMINGSKDGNIDTLRIDVQDFASTVSFSGGKKVVILDEADYMNPTSTQPALRGFIEEFAKNCRFIFTCNYPNKIIPALHSRCSVIDFGIQQSERKQMSLEILKRLVEILKEESIQFDAKVLSAFVVKNFPDFRRMLNELQRSSFDGAISIADLNVEFDEHLSELLQILKNKDLRGAHAWVAQYSASETNIYGKLYTFLAKHAKSSSIPQLVLHCHDFDYRNAFSSDKSLCMVAALVNLMADIEYE